jgi:glucose-1-phosphate adenylyltransferase
MTQRVLLIFGVTYAIVTTVHRSIIDKECYIGSGCWVGCGDDYTPNKEEPDCLNSGITVIGKAARLPPGLMVGRNCKIDTGVKDSDFSSLSIPSGSSVEKSPQGLTQQ